MNNKSLFNTNAKGYTKHYYAESERIASRIGGGGIIEIDSPIVRREDVKKKVLDLNSPHLKKVLDCLQRPEVYLKNTLEDIYRYKDIVEHEDECYWYHPASSWITYSDGSAVQHLHYLPWGEDFVDQRSTNWNAMYTFSAKEKDTETGYSYFGARYYSSDLSIWLSVDPMAAKYAHQSNYVYCSDNPIRMIDPNGEEGIVVSGGEHNNGRYTYNFIEPAITPLKELKAAGGDESITWVVMTAGYSKEDIEKFQSVANDLGVGFQAISSAEEFTNYLNSKDIGTNMLSDARKNDKITSLTVFGHGIPGSAEFAYGQQVVSLFSWGLTGVEKLNKGAFDNADINLYTCNSATDCEVRMPMAGENAKRIRYVH